MQHTRDTVSFIFVYLTCRCLSAQQLQKNARSNPEGLLGSIPRKHVGFTFMQYIKVNGVSAACEGDKPVLSL